LAVVGAVLAVASSARAHEDPPGCFETGPAIIVSVFRANGTTGVVGSVSECETINYRATLQKATNTDTICAFSGGTFKLTLPNGTVVDINLNVPCIGGTAGEGCDPAVTQIQSALIPYVVSDADIVGGFVTATAAYTGGVAHDTPGNTPGVAANTPKSTPVVECVDNNLCTTDVCDPALQGAAACSFPPVVCIDNDLCTADACNPDTGLCTFTPNVVCDDNSLCTSEACDPATGQCVFTPTVTCDDNSLCTSDACDPATGNCVFTPTVICTDNNLCTADACDPATGNCVFTPNVTCNDNNQCTADACDPTTGSCTFTPDVTCDDQNLCTSDACNPATGTCVFTPTVTCTDNNLCTADACDPATGQCVFTPNVACNDNSLCTSDACNPATGTCTFTNTVTCNDNSVCTNEQCNPATGQCVFTPALNCDDNDQCTDDRCDPVDGCVNVPNQNPECLGLNHFQCYEIKPFAFARRTATVTDRYGTSPVNIRIPNRLCAPSDKRGEDPTAPLDPEHLTAFPSLSSPVRQPGQVVENQFGRLRLDIVRRTLLMVPSAKSLVSQPPALANPGNHFQCYLVRRSSGEPRFQTIRGVSAVDQFGSHAMDILRPKYLCVPADKNGEDPTAPSSAENLLCYKVKHRVRFGDREPFITNQFLSSREEIIRRMEFCVPTTFVENDD
jgi:hypothetical protein